MKQIIIPIILAVTVVITGIFAFSPVEQASTVHSTFLDGNGGVLSLEKTLAVSPDPGEIWTFRADSKTVITSIWYLGEEDHCITEFSFGDSVMRGTNNNILDGNTLCENGDTSDLQDLLRLWEDNLNNPIGWADYMPLDADKELRLGFKDDSVGDGAGNLTVWISYQRGEGATLE